MKNDLRISCEGCASHCSKSDKSFRYTRFSKGQEIHISQHDNHLIFVLSGKLSVQNKGSEYLCQQNQMVLLANTEVYRVAAVENGDMLMLNFMVNQQICDSMGIKDVKRILDVIEYQFITLDCNAQIQTYLTTMVKFLKDDIHCKHLHTPKMTELFIIFHFYYSIEDICRFFYPIIYKDIGFNSAVLANYDQAKNVQELADLCGYGLSNFKKVFATHFGLTPYQWILQQKVSKVKARLMDKSVPLKTVAMELGFADQSHLNKYCKRYFNATPLQIREEEDDQ